MVKQSIDLLQNKLQATIAKSNTIPTIQGATISHEKQELEAEINEIQLQIRDLKALPQSIKNIIEDIEIHKITVPSWFLNNVNWVKTNQITPTEFLGAYENLKEQGLVISATAPVIESVSWYWVKKPSGIIERIEITESSKAKLESNGWIFSRTNIWLSTPEPTPEPIPEPIPEPTIDISITDNMIIQRLDSFSIVNGRAIGQITFTATDSFNPAYYGVNISNIIQFKTPNGVNILPFVKENTLRFTATERTETIQYDEGMNENTRANVESFVWSSVTQPTPFSKQLKFEIVTAQEGQPAPIPKVQTSGIMGAGVSGAIGILILLGFIADSRRK